MQGVQKWFLLDLLNNNSWVKNSKILKWKWFEIFSPNIQRSLSGNDLNYFPNIQRSLSGNDLNYFPKSLNGHDVNCFQNIQEFCSKNELDHFSKIKINYHSVNDCPVTHPR